jgi:hypothetical protein
MLLCRRLFAALAGWYFSKSKTFFRVNNANIFVGKVETRFGFPAENLDENIVTPLTANILAGEMENGFRFPTGKISSVTPAANIFAGEMENGFGFPTGNILSVLRRKISLARQSWFS